MSRQPRGWPGDADQAGDDSQPGDDDSQAGDRQPTASQPAARGGWDPPADDDPAGDLDGDGQAVLPAFLSPLQEWRFIRNARGTVADHIDYAQNGAYSMDDGWVRTAHIIYAYTFIPIGQLLCDSIRWALFTRLSRAIAAIPVIVALLWLLNHLPIAQWLIPDQWDISTWIPGPDPGLVEVPVEAPLGDG